MNNNSLPNHLIFEYILPKLPVKSLLRFKSVSKSWLSTISSPEFAKSHLQSSSSSSSSPLQFILLAGPDRVTVDEFHLLTYYDNNNNYDLKQLVELGFEDGCDSPVCSIHILGSCNGLVCIYPSEGDVLFIGNPATRRFRKIIIPEGLYLQSINCSVFYYESSTDNYKIFGLFSSFGGMDAHFYVFSLSSGNWVRIGVLDNVVTSELDEEEAVLIDKTIYISVKNELGVSVVVGFDLITEQIKQLPWIVYWANNYSSVRLSKLRGYLLFLCSRPFDADDVWMLKDPNDMNSLEKLFPVNVCNVLYYGFTDNGKCLLHTEGKQRVFDPTRETPQMAQGGIAFDNGYSIEQSKSYIESLVSPFGNR